MKISMRAAIIEAFRRHTNTRNTIKELNSLTDDELNDIGINRGDIQNIARGVLDVHRAVRDHNEQK